MPDWDRLMKIAERSGIALIEDAAEAVGSSWRGRPAGAFGTMSAFSFHGSKTLTTGEGGMLVLDDEHLLERVLRLRDHGRAPGDTMFFNEEVGWKYKMSSMQAALGLAQLERIDELVAKKREIYGWYHEELADWNGGTLNPEVSGLYNSYWMTTIVLERAFGLTKDVLVPALRQRGVDVRPFFHPLSGLPAFRASPQAVAARARNSNSYTVTPYGINLPSALALERSDVAAACSVLRAVVASTACMTATDTP
jgi:perosamine synthetase